MMILRLSLGAVFVFSGFTKINDPIGTSIKLQEYFSVFASDGWTLLSYLTPITLPLAIILVVLEVLLGAALLLGYRMRITMPAIGGLLLFFAWLTFYSAYYNKVTDCGCFGDAIKLTPWGSFIKDLVLIALWIGVFILYHSGKAKDHAPQGWQKLDTYLVAIFLFSTTISMIAVFYLPFIDFRPYKVGAHIPTLRKPSAPIQYTYLFKKGSKIERLDSYVPKEGYTFAGTELKNPEDLPLIKDYALWNEQEDVTEASLQGTKLLIVVQSISDLNLHHTEVLALLCNKFKDQAEAWVVTSVPGADWEKTAHKSGLSHLSYYYADATLLKTMLRSEWGVVLLKDGTVRGKWSSHYLPNDRSIRRRIKD